MEPTEQLNKNDISSNSQDTEPVEAKRNSSMVPYENETLYEDDTEVKNSNNMIDDVSELKNDTSDYLNKLFDLTSENKKLKLVIEKLEKDVSHLETNSSSDWQTIQLETLEKTITQQRSEIERLNNTLIQQTEASQRQITQLKEEYNHKEERLVSQYEKAIKDREAMVMKYAVSENSAINLQRQIKQLENKVKDQTKEKESLDAKIRIYASEKAKLSQQIDAKDSEIMGIKLELQKKKDEIHAQSSNLKFFQNKLKLELESHKETQILLEKMTQKVKETKEEAEQVRLEGQAILRRYETEGRKVLELQDAKEVTILQTEVDSWRQKCNDITNENYLLYKKVQALETERLEIEEKFSKLKQNLDDYQQSVIDLHSAQAELESTRLLLQREQERLASCQLDVERHRQANLDLQQEMTQCRNREAELLSFTQMLTEKNVALQSSYSTIEARAQQQELDLVSTRRDVVSLTEELTAVKEELASEQRKRSEEIEMLSRHLKERTEAAERLSHQLEDQIGENQLLKKKHLASIKELNRELQACRRRVEANETVSLGPGSRTSSSTSLNNLEVSEPRTALPIEPDRQLLIEKIIKVQRSNARKQEKLEFLEEHARQLVVELQKKSRIIQNLVMKQQPGALASEIMDDNKAALTKHGGVMASVYSSKPVDNTMTLELSLEINRKLQAVLEDALLKNITLKENMETLGNEIARLTSLQHPTT